MEEKSMNIYGRLNLIKKELSESDIPKSGKNKHLNFAYHELNDFLGKITQLNAKHGVHEHITMNNDLATLILTNVDDKDDKIEISVPFVMADMQPKNDSIQKLGATLTYLRRYLYLQGYAIMEKEIVDAQDQKVIAITKEEAQKKLTALKSYVEKEIPKDYQNSLKATVLTSFDVKEWEDIDFDKVNYKELREKVVNEINEIKKKQKETF